VLPKVVGLELCPGRKRAQFGKGMEMVHRKSELLARFDRNGGTLELKMRLLTIRAMGDHLDDLHEDSCANRLRRVNSTEHEVVDGPTACFGAAV
jgi:hypothetical protein